MAAHRFKFVEQWIIPDARIEEVYDVLARGELLPQWWKGVYLDAVRLTPGSEPEVGTRLRVRVRGFLPFVLNFEIEASELEPPRRVSVRTSGDLNGAWSATLTQKKMDVQADLLFEVEIDRPGMRILAPLLRPLFALNHYWTTPRGEQGLKEFVAMRRKERDALLTFSS
jgi:hypothetical protein